MDARAAQHRIGLQAPSERSIVFARDSSLQRPQNSRGRRAAGTSGAHHGTDGTRFVAPSARERHSVRIVPPPPPATTMKLATTLLTLLSLLAPTALHAQSQTSTPGATLEQPLPRRGALGLGFSALPRKQAEKAGLARGEGLIANAPTPGLTAEKIGFEAGDVVLRFNGAAVSTGTIGAAIRATPAGSQVEFEILRKEAPLKLRGELLEKPRDPGNENYEVVYSHVTNNGQRMRTILTRPRKPGPHPGFMFIQGFSPVSYDFVLATAKGDVATIDGPLLHRIANSGYVTIRVEKPGVGDSEGGPFAELNYQDEIGIYREALAQLKATAGVDVNNVFLFGHSMGAAFGPMIAADNPVKGIAVYGGAARTWFEYLLDTLRYQGLVAGESFESSDEKVRHGARVMARVMLEAESPESVKAELPELAALVDSLFPGGRFNDKTLDFWRQLNEINFAEYWNKLDCHVLAVKGASDFVVYEADHKLIADIVNRRNPGRAKFVIALNCDHLLHAFATEPESLRNFQRGEYSDSFEKLLVEWMAEVRSRN
jgi:pimeloyl-ACP methyl ester carboxylesterase